MRLRVPVSADWVQVVIGISFRNKTRDGWAVYPEIMDVQLLSRRLADDSNPLAECQFTHRCLAEETLPCCLRPR